MTVITMTQFMPFNIEYAVKFVDKMENGIVK